MRAECRTSTVVALHCKVEWLKVGFANKMADSVLAAHLDQNSSFSSPGHCSRARDVGHLDWVDGTVEKVNNAQQSWKK